MNALELKNKITKELKYLGILFILGIIIFKIAFYKESILQIVRTITSIFWLFILPGFGIMYYWHEKIEFPTRLILGIGLSAAVIGIASYYIGLFGLHIKYHTVLLPLVLLIIATYIIRKK